MKKIVLAAAVVFFLLAGKAWAADAPEIPPDALPFVTAGITGSILFLRSLRKK